MDYSLFDSLIDSVFIINENKEILYCNESAATVADSSVRRLTKNKVFHDIITFSDKNLFTMPKGDWGKSETTNFTEVDYKTKTKSGKIQVCIQPAADNRWVVILHDVTLEETLHSKYHLQLKQKEDVILQLENAHKKLEDYSKNLEKMVDERTEELNQANLSLKAIMNSLGQGFLIFDETGTCGDIYTKACEKILESNPSGKTIIEVLNTPENEKAQIDMWIKAVFSESLPFESLKELGPDIYAHSDKKFITLDFYPIRDSKDKIINVVLVATDKTLEHEAQIAMEKEKKHSKMILKLIKNKKQFKEFLDQCIVRISDAKSESEKGIDKFDLKSSFRTLHTIEGEAGIFAAEDIRLASRSSQKLLNEMQAKFDDAKIKTFKKFTDSLDSLEAVYKSFIKSNKTTFNIIGLNKTDEIMEVKKSDISKFLKKLNSKNISNDIILQYEEIFMKESIKEILHVYNELTQNIAEKQDKLIHPIKFSGKNLKVDAKKFEPISSSLVHAFRNIIDHGLESPSERKQVSKDEYGHIEIQLSSDTDGIYMLIKDDGAGISIEKIREKLVTNFPDEKSEIESQDEEWVLQQIFRPGFSSRDEISEFSGRGVGMDAIKTSVINLGGSVNISSKKGQGTQLQLFIPHEVDLRPLAKTG